MTPTTRLTLTVYACLACGVVTVAGLIVAGVWR